MTTAFRPYLLLTAALLLFCMTAGSSAGACQYDAPFSLVLLDKGEDVQRLIEKHMSMPITTVGNASVMDLKVTDFQESPKPDPFRLNRAPGVGSPFELIDPQGRVLKLNDLIPSANGVVLFRVRFRPTAPGSYRETIIARRPNGPNEADEIVIIVEGFAFVPARTEPVKFDSVIIGESAQRLVQTHGVGPGGQWKIDPPQPPFSIVKGDSVPDPLKPGEFLTDFLVKFNPLSTGLKKGRATLIRQRSIGGDLRVLDTLYLEISGIGKEIGERTAIQFKTLMVGDSSRGRASISRPAINRIIYKIHSIPDVNGPFRIHGNDPGLDEPLSPGAPVFVEKDSLRIVASFAPASTSASDYVDSVVLYRFRENNSTDALDSVVCLLHGNARTMQAETTLTFSGQKIGKLDSQTVVFHIPEELITRSFKYAIKPEYGPASVVWGEVSERSPTKADKIETKIFCQPKAVGAHSEKLYLIRMHASPGTEGEVDRTLINVNSEVQPRTVTLRASMARETNDALQNPTYSDDSLMQARIGDTVVVAVFARTNDPIDRLLEFSTVRCSLSYNPTVLVPLITPGDEVIASGVQTEFVFGSANTVQLPANSNGALLARASFVVVMGDAEYSPLTMTNLTLEPRDFVARLEMDTVAVHVTNVWRDQNGDPRLINPIQKDLVLNVSPNPVSASVPTNISFDAFEGVGTLQVVSSEGVVVADLTSALRDPNARPIAFPTTLTRGIYFVRLLATQDGSTTASDIRSVVRIVMVE